MNIGTELWLFAVSLGASALGGMLGMASGIFIVPVLTMCCHRYTKRRFFASSHAKLEAENAGKQGKL